MSLSGRPCPQRRPLNCSPASDASFRLFFQETGDKGLFAFLSKEQSGKRTLLAPTGLQSWGPAARRPQSCQPLWRALPRWPAWSLGLRDSDRPGPAHIPRSGAHARITLSAGREFPGGIGHRTHLVHSAGALEGRGAHMQILKFLELEEFPSRRFCSWVSLCSVLGGRCVMLRTSMTDCFQGRDGGCLLVHLRWSAWGWGRRDLGAGSSNGGIAGAGPGLLTWGPPALGYMSTRSLFPVGDFRDGV